MGSGPYVGSEGKVTLGSDVVLGMGAWTMTGIVTDQLESTEFTDDWKTYKFGLKDGGQVTFNGWLRAEDITGQQAIMEANLYNSNLTNLWLYVDNTSYYTPCQSTGYFSPSVTTGAGTKLSYVNITAYDIAADKSGLITVTFTAKVSGTMVLV